MTSLPSSLSALPPASLSLPPPNFQPVLEPFLQGHHQIQAEKVQAEGDVRERRPSLGALLQQQQPSLLPQQAAGNPQVHQLGGQPQAFNLLQQPNIVQQLSALQQQHPSPAVSTTVDYTPLKVHESLASRAASPVTALGRTEEGHVDLARLLQYQHPAFGVGMPPTPATLASAATNLDQQQQPDQGWRMPQYRPMMRKDDQAGSRREVGLPWTGLPPQLGQDRWLPPSAHHQVGSTWTGWQDRASLHLHPDFLRMQMQERFARGDDCGSGLSRESSRDDINSECEQQFEYEQRFRVDRRKLELMMMNSPEFGEVAAEFFERIGAETNTCVIWPSRLKVGAKSKKDPHIRVGGCEEGVKRAKTMITEVLDTTTNSRVTMKMDVSYTDHSHIIGKGGNTIRRVMAETNCHIHFPDSNRSNPNEKSNQVSIAGEMSGVERARARVRELTPLLFNFDLPIVPSFQQAPDTNSPFLRAIQDQYNIQIMFRQKQKNFHTTTVVVKGCEWECSRVKEATLLLMDNLCTGLATSVPVVMLMEVSPQHHATVLGKGNINLKIVMQRTNTVIIFPDAGDPNIPPIKKGSVSISGAIHNVYLARQLLLGSLPVVMMFDLPESLDVDEAMINKLQEEHDINISIKPKARQMNKSCIIKAQERNCAGVYIARHTLLQLDRQEEPLVRAEIPETYKVPLVGSSSNSCMAAAPATRGPYLNVNTQLANSLSTSPLSPAYMPGTPVYTPSLARPNSPWHQQASLPTCLPPPPPPPPSTPVGGLAGLPPNHPFLQDYAMLVLQNMNRLQQQAAQQHSHQQAQEGELQVGQSSQPAVSPSQNQDREAVKTRPAVSPYQNTDGVSGNTSSGLGSSLHSSPLRRSSPRYPVPRNSSPTHAGGNLTAQAHKMDLSGGGGSSGSGDASKENSSGGICNLSAILSDLSCGDRRAPGCEKKVAQIATAADYEQKRLMATKAMHHKPAGETRTPTPAWSGLGFSCSMPEAVIRELEHSKARAAREKEVASNSDWFGASINTLGESMVAGREGREASGEKFVGDGLPVLLANQGLSKYADIFVRHEIDLPTFATLTDEELKEIGIPTFGARKKLLLLARETKKKLGSA